MSSTLAHTVGPVTHLDGDGALFLQVKRLLLQRIEARLWLAGQALPNESVLAAELGVSIGTLRRAVEELVHERVLVRRQGKGTYLAEHSRKRFLFQFFRVETRGSWPEPGLARELEYPSVECIAFERQRADAVSARALRLRTGAPVWVIHNRLSLQKRPIMLDRITISAQLFKGMTEQRFRSRESTVYNLYQADFGITVLRAEERARASLASADMVRHLGVAAGTPVLEIQRLALSFGERPVEWRMSTLHTHLHDYVIDVLGKLT